jgi:integrase
MRKGNKARRVYLNQGGAMDLERRRAVRGEQDGALFQPVNRDGRIQRLKRLSGAAVADAIANRASQANIELVRAHDLRRSHISPLLDAGSTGRYDRRVARTLGIARAIFSWRQSTRP